MSPHDDALRHLDDALLALQIAGEAFDRAMDGLKETIEAVKVANHAQQDAIVAVINANRSLRDGAR